MNRRSFFIGAVSLPIVAQVGLAARRPENSLSEHSFGTPQGGDAAAAAGPDLSRYHLTLERVLNGQGPAYTPDFLLADIQAIPGRRFTNFSGDLSGRWIGALAISAQTFGGNFPALHEVVNRTVALQHPNGYFGGSFHLDDPNDDDLALLWGNGRLLVGLMEYYSLNPDPRVLDAAKKLGNFLLAIAPKFNSQAMADAFSAAHYGSSYICWTQQTEGLAALYAATRDERYRDLAAAISMHIQRRPSDHVHGYLSSLRGTLALYEATGDRRYLDQVTAAWRDISDSGDLLITGGVPERWTPTRERTEGCGECDWLRLNLGLHRATGEAVYLETAQNTYFNEFCMNQFDTGDFGLAKLDPAGVPQIVYVRAWWCCTLHGLRAFADVHNAAFRRAGKQVFFEFPVDSHINAEGFSAKASSRLTTDGTVRLDITRAGAGHALAIAQPTWADGVTVRRNGHAVSGTTLDKLAAGDVVEVRYNMSPRRTQRTGAADSDPGTVLHYGPWLLGVSGSVAPNYFNELYLQNQLEIGSAREESRAGASVEVPVAARMVAYLPAEFPDQPQSIELRAVADQTAHPPGQWQLVFAEASRG